MAAPNRQIRALDTTAGPVQLVVHLPQDNRARDTAVLMLPPFGWDDVCAYRPMRDWADGMATLGYPTVRLTYPSCGDSAGTASDPGRLDAWTSAVAESATWAVTATGRSRLAVIAIELGGLLACRALAGGTEIDDLVLWSVPATGRQFVRRMQAFANLEATPDDSAADPVAAEDDGMAAGGFRLSDETMRDLLAYDVADLPGLGAAGGRILLLGRDGLAPDNRLRTHLQETGAELSRGAGLGYAGMTAAPFESDMPVTTVEEVAAWLDEGSGPADPVGLAPPDGAPVRIPADGGVVVHESQVTFDGPSGPLAGIVTAPATPVADGPCVVFLNAGTIRRIGPNRWWVEAARRWAAHGTTSVRFDLEGLGDSDGDPTPFRDFSNLFDPRIVEQALSVLGQVRTRGIASRFMLVGLSSGAYWALHCALRDDGVDAVAMLNPGTLVWDPGKTPLGDFRTLRSILRTRSISRATLRKAFGPRGLALGLWLLRALLTRSGGRRDDRPVLVRGSEELRRAIDELREMTAERLLLFSNDEPVLTELEGIGMLETVRQTPGIAFERLATNDHTLRPLWAQREVHAALDRLLERQRDATARSSARV